MPFDLVEEDTLQPPTLSLSERIDVVQELIEEFGQNGFGRPVNGGNIADRLGLGEGGFGGSLEGWSLFKLPPNEIFDHLERGGRYQSHQYLSTLPFAREKLEIYAIDPARNRQNLLKIDSWDFNWQGDYPLAKYIKIDKGVRSFMPSPPMTIQLIIP